MLLPLLVLDTSLHPILCRVRGYTQKWVNDDTVPAIKAWNISIDNREEDLYKAARYLSLVPGAGSN
jgi:hypothetical protein